MGASLTLNDVRSAFSALHAAWDAYLAVPSTVAQMSESRDVWDAFEKLDALLLERLLELERPLTEKPHDSSR